MQISELYRCVSHPLPVARKSNRGGYMAKIKTIAAFALIAVTMLALMFALGGATL